jgi:hypothetical protein
MFERIAERTRWAASGLQHKQLIYRLNSSEPPVLRAFAWKGYAPPMGSEPPDARRAL